ncbi:hypothetical protein L218DRAFT_983827 [Marasmius fiardii PR-910]|nr:hypothetical protein L218DRAFT_983827 [Marasmius fiardii PR-910]
MYRGPPKLKEVDSSGPAVIRLGQSGGRFPGNIKLLESVDRVWGVQNFTAQGSQLQELQSGVEAVKGASSVNTGVNRLSIHWQCLRVFIKVGRSPEQSQCASIKMNQSLGRSVPSGGEAQGSNDGSLKEKLANSERQRLKRDSLETGWSATRIQVQQGPTTIGVEPFRKGLVIKADVEPGNASEPAQSRSISRSSVTGWVELLRSDTSKICRKVNWDGMRQVHAAWVLWARY